ncbi:hypothetical protein BC941DRAFT_404478 [Chlamydoabsidia padenii]|nr:hypothetical protein BC941DRAFT_404478 [Chlamydoabsidia padenii]
MTAIAMDDPERQRFMKELQQFHDEKGTVLQPEQILGGKKLDLYTIYNRVIAAGGYEQVSNSRAWKQIGEPFRFPITCTNSAYILKALYTRNLLGWEQEKHWNRPWVPPQEDVKGRTGGSNTVVRPKDEARGTATVFTQVGGQPAQPIRPSGHSGVFLGFPAHLDEEFRSRMLLALQSGLPNEVDWVFNTLVRFSYSSENFSLDYMPSLIDHLIDFIDPFLQQHQSEENNLLCTRSEQTERALQVLHILRNFSFLDNNLKRLAHHTRLGHILMLCLDSSSTELTRHCLDILENIAPQVILAGPDDPYLQAMTRFLLDSNDRALILGAIRSLTRVAVTEVNEPVLLRIPPDHRTAILQRLFQFLLIDDEELMAASLEYFYQYTGLRTNDFGRDLLEAYPGKNLVGLLVGLLSYKSSVVAPSSFIHGIPAAQLAASQQARLQQSMIPDLTDYANLDEPYRCLGWLKDKLMPGNATDTLPLKDLMALYQDRFGAEKPFGLKEFSTVLMIAFPQTADVQKAATGPGPLIDLVLKNIKFTPEKQPHLSTCHWNGCQETVNNQIQDLLDHIIQTHSIQTRCEWKTCTRTVTSRPALVAHLRTHLESNTPYKKRRVQKFAIDPLLVDSAEVAGVPLTAALILRELAPAHQTYFRPYETDLTSLAIHRPTLAKYILAILSSL